jgi:hypothetical protein
VIDVGVRNILSSRDTQDLGASLTKPIEQRGIRVRSDSIEVAVVKQLLKSAVDSVFAFLFEETKNLRSRDESVLEDRSKEFLISILKGDRRTMRALRPRESG